MSVAMANEACKKMLGVIESLCDIETEHEKDINELRRFFRGLSDTLAPAYIYNDLAEAFAQRYAKRNCLKLFPVFDQLKARGVLERCQRVVDVGSGPGTVPLAMYLWSLQDGIDQKENLPGDFLLLDASETFLSMAEQSLNSFFLSSKTAPSITFLESYLRDSFPSEAEDADIIFFSNSLGEILRNPETDEESLIDDLVELACPTVIVDYEYPHLQENFCKFDERMKQEEGDYIGLSGDMKSVPEWVWNIKRRSSESPGKDFLRWTEAMWFPDKGGSGSAIDDALRLIRRYKEAWENHDTEILRHLFTTDAQYDEGPGRPVYSGIEQIEQYWRRISCEQENVYFKPLDIETDGDRISVAWESTFWRNDLKRWMHLRGDLKAEIEGERIAYFTENFEAETVGK